MNFNVPQFVDIEDKIAFRLTARQLGWFALGGVVLFIIWSVFTKVVFYASFVFVAGASAAFAFYRPNNISLARFIFLGIVYAVRPKTYFWGKNFDKNIKDRPIEIGIKKKAVGEMSIEKIKEKRFKDISSLADVLDHKSDL